MHPLAAVVLRPRTTLRAVLEEDAARWSVALPLAGGFLVSLATAAPERGALAVTGAMLGGGTLVVLVRVQAWVLRLSGWAFRATGAPSRVLAAVNWALVPTYAVRSALLPLAPGADMVELVETAAQAWSAIVLIIGVSEAFRVGILRALGIVAVPFVVIVSVMALGAEL